MRKIRFFLVFFILAALGFLPGDGEVSPTPAGTVIVVGSDEGVIGEPDITGDLVGEVDNGIVIVSATSASTILPVRDFDLARQDCASSATVGATYECVYRITSKGNAADAFAISASSSLLWSTLVADSAGNAVNQISVSAGASADFKIKAVVPEKAVPIPNIFTVVVKDNQGTGTDDGWGLKPDTQNDLFAVAAMPAAFDHLEVIQPAKAVAGERILLRVKAVDVYGNLRQNENFTVSLAAYADASASSTTAGTFTVSRPNIQGVGWTMVDAVYTKAERIFVGAVRLDAEGSNLKSGLLRSFTEIRDISGASLPGASLAGKLAGAYINPAATTDETWIIVFQNETDYKVQGSFSGIQGAGSIKSDFISLNGALTIPSSVWTGAFKAGDAFSFEGVRGTIVLPNRPAKIYASAVPRALQANGSATSSVTALVKDRFDNLVLPAEVAFSIKPALGLLSATSAVTVNGSATALLTSVADKFGPALFTASHKMSERASIASSIPIFFYADGSKDIVVQATGAPTIFVPAGTLPPGVVALEARLPEEAQGDGRIPVEDMRSKIREALAQAKKGNPPDIVTLALTKGTWQFTAWRDDGSVYQGDFNGQGVQLRIPYPDADKDGITDPNWPAKLLRLFWLNDRETPFKWEMVDNAELREDEKEVWVWVKHFSVYSLQGIQPPIQTPKNLAYVSVYPNPFVLNGGAMTIINLPRPEEMEFVKIYNIAGEQVADLNLADMKLGNLNNDYRGYELSWNGRVRNGNNKVASGVYLVVIKARNGDKPRIIKIGIVK